jgi:hypothetical protein
VQFGTALGDQLVFVNRCSRWRGVGHKQSKQLGC